MKKLTTLSWVDLAATRFNDADIAAIVAVGVPVSSQLEKDRRDETELMLQELEAEVRGD